MRIEDQYGQTETPAPVTHVPGLFCYLSPRPVIAGTSDSVPSEGGGGRVMQATRASEHKRKTAICFMLPPSRRPGMGHAAECCSQVGRVVSTRLAGPRKYAGRRIGISVHANLSIEVSVVRVNRRFLATTASPAHRRRTSERAPTTSCSRPASLGQPARATPRCTWRRVWMRPVGPGANRRTNSISVARTLPRREHLLIGLVVCRRSAVARDGRWCGHWNRSSVLTLWTNSVVRLNFLFRRFGVGFCA
jgi:hypothetical protein